MRASEQAEINEAPVRKDDCANIAWVASLAIKILRSLSLCYSLSQPQLDNTFEETPRQFQQEEKFSRWPAASEHFNSE